MAGCTWLTPLAADGLDPVDVPARSRVPLVVAPAMTMTLNRQRRSAFGLAGAPDPRTAGAAAVRDRLLARGCR